MAAPDQHVMPATITDTGSQGGGWLEGLSNISWLQRTATGRNVQQWLESARGPST